jgi:hypothetical protein
MYFHAALPRVACSQSATRKKNRSRRASIVSVSPIAVTWLPLA